jgi:YD repeat-containing protein
MVSHFSRRGRCTAWTAPTQNAVGNLTQTPQPLALGSGYDLKYDAWNRLVEVKVTGGSVVATHRYDGANGISKFSGNFDGNR